MGKKFERRVDRLFQSGDPATYIITTYLRDKKNKNELVERFTTHDPVEADILYHNARLRIFGDDDYFEGHNRHGNIRCERCGSFNLECCVCWDGCDEESEAGEGSGYDCLVSLDCMDCSRVYPIIRLKSDYHVGKECYSFIKENKENGKD